NDDRRGTHWCVLTGKSEVARFPIDAESSDRVTPLITRIKKIPCGVDIKAARIIASSPFFPVERKGARLADGKPGDTVVQPIGSIDESSVMRDHDLRSK